MIKCMDPDIGKNTKYHSILLGEEMSYTEVKVAYNRVEQFYKDRLFWDCASLSRKVVFHTGPSTLKEKEIIFPVYKGSNSITNEGECFALKQEVVYWLETKEKEINDKFILSFLYGKKRNLWMLNHRIGYLVFFNRNLATLFKLTWL